MMKRALLSLGSIFGLGFGLVALAPSAAHAVANHKIEEVQKIVKKNPKTGKQEIVGARVHLLVDPQGYQNFRVNLAPQKKLTAAQKKDDTSHRKLLAGMIGKFIHGTLAEQLGVANQTQELYVDINYAKLGLKPGQKVNLLSSYTSDKFTKTSNTGPHTFGAWDGPVNQNDTDYIITLPSAASKLPKAQKTVSGAAAQQAAPAAAQ